MNFYWRSNRVARNGRKVKDVLFGMQEIQGFRKWNFPEISKIRCLDLDNGQ